MSFKDLSNDEKKNLQLIFSDLKKIFEKDEILAPDIDDFIQKLETPEVKSYITFLKNGGKAEAALREAFFAGQSLLSRYLASDMMPEINTGDGFLDYKIFSGNRFVMMELKPLFEAETHEAKGGRELVKLKQKKLNWATYESQILKYIKKGGEFIVITDLKDWYFFDDTVTKQNCKPFLKTEFHNMEKDFAMVENFYGLIERYASTSLREELDKVFFADLKIWVKKLLEVNFNIEEKKKIEIVLGIINKFIFIQTLDDHSIIEFRWIQKTWEYSEQRWGSRSKFEVLRQFFDDTIKWFFKFYDTELFVNNEVDFLKNEKENVDKFYDTIRLVLGLTYLASDIGGQRGVMQYKFRFIDEDIFGKAYETFLGEARHDEAVYYTPKYITQYVVENTVGKIFDVVLLEIKKNLRAGDFTSAAKNISELTKIKVLDPACGSGSFLIKAVREIWKRYSELSILLNQILKESDVFETLTRDSKVDEKVSKIKHLQNLLGFKTNRELISKLLLRHIHGNDVDPRAVAVAKVNLWLEAVKMSPSDFRYDKLPSDTNRILPYLEMNLVNGDSVVGLPDNEVIDYLVKNHKEALSTLSKLRHSYLDNPTDPELVDKIEEQKHKLKAGLIEEFSKHLEKSGISKKLLEITIPHFWPLELWYLYFEDSTPLPEDSRGADCVVGNPPYVRIQVLQKKSPDYVPALDNGGFRSATKNYDLAVIFIEKGFNLLKKNGEFGYIVTNKFIQGDYGEGIRTLLSEQKAVKEIVDFGDQQVFKGEDATTYTALIFLKKCSVEEFKYLLVKKLQENIEQLSITTPINNNEIEMFNVKGSDLTSEPWVFAGASDKIILDKLIKLPKLGDVTDRIFQGLVTGADPVFILKFVKEESGLIRAFSKSLKKEVLLEKHLTRPLLKGQDIKKWNVAGYDEIILFPYIIENEKAVLIDETSLKTKYPKIYAYFVENKEALERREDGKWKGVTDWYAHGRRQNIEQFDQDKIMTQVLASQSSFALDRGNKYYFVGGGNAGGYGVSLPSSSKISLEYLLALLNSSLLDWKLRKKSSRFHGGFYSYAKRFIEGLPILIPDKTQEVVVNSIENLVKEIVSNKKLTSKFYDIWNHWINQMKDAERTFGDILRMEEDNIKDGDLQNTWFAKVSFLFSKKDPITSEKFDYFKIRGDYEKSQIEIFGVNESGEKFLFEFVLKDKSLVDHFYLSLSTTIESRAKVETLEDLFEKSKITVLQPNPPQKTPNIMLKVIDEFSKEGHKQPSFVKMENKIEEGESQIDALIFKLYGLKQSECDSILNSLSLPQSYQNKVNQYFQGN